MERRESEERKREEEREEEGERRRGRRKKKRRERKQRRERKGKRGEERERLNCHHVNNGSYDAHLPDSLQGHSHAIPTPYLSLGCLLVVG